jgi:4-hydroxysphinganine ceramide fatty acyl 2-hydroxylase
MLSAVIPVTYDQLVNIFSFIYIAKKGLTVKNYISNKDESVRMFKSDFLEFFTHVHPSVPLIIFIPVITSIIYYCIYILEMTTKDFILYFILGIFVWTLTEYLLHRFFFHLKPSNKVKERIYFMVHGVHHDYPNDTRRLVMVPSVSIPLAILFFWLFSILIGKVFVFAFFPGFLTGYLFYDMAHYATHHFSMNSRIGSYIKKHHMRHHYQSSKKYFGVSSPLWDFIFRTI